MFRYKKSKIDLKIHRKYTVKRFQKKIDMLGYKDTYDANIFLNVRLFSSIAIFFMLLYLLDWGIFIAPIITVVYYIFLPKLLIENKLNKV